MSQLEIDVTAAASGAVGITVASMDEKRFPVGGSVELAANPPVDVERRVAFFVPGDPQPKGSHVILGRNTGKPWLQEQNAGPRANWRAHAADRARAARGDRPLLDEAVRVTMTVLRIRPKGHFGSGKNAGVLKASAPPYPTSAPDLDKLQRSLGDALNGVLWRDDAQISTWRVARRWGTEAGIMVIVQPELVP